MDHKFRPKPDIRDPHGVGLCDRCQFPFRHVDLLRQMAWRANRLIWTGWLVCRKHLDKPQDQDRAIKLRPDPVPIKYPRPDQ